MSVYNWDGVIKQARDCHTKQAWEGFFEAHGEALATGGNSKPIAEICKMLRADPQSLQYEPKIWGRLIQGCLSSWNLELGREIAEFAKKIPSIAITIPAAQLYLESGMPSTTRELAHRALRLTGLAQAERLQLEMLIASSYAEEGKRQKTIRILNEIRSSMQSSDLQTKERADFLMAMGRMQFVLGRYLQAAEVFYDASRLFRELRDWESAARCIFNTAACHLNGGTSRKDEAFAMIEECRRLAERENLPGPLSHCEAAYGMDAYQHGDFAAAREHLRRALEYLPISDKSVRRLHILSMLAYTYLAMGRYHLAKKFASQTFDLAALDESQRFKTRYTTLRAELLWEDGLIDESQALLESSVTPLETHGVHTLEELATLSRFLLQSAYLNEKQGPERFEIDETLKKNLHSWLDYHYACGQIALNRFEFAEAEGHFNECLAIGRQTGDRHHEALGLLGLIQSLLKQRRVDATDGVFRELEIVVARLGETPLKAQLLFIHAARNYQLGNFAEAEKLLRHAQKAPRQSFADRFVLGAWIATIEGRSSRLTADWQSRMIARFTRVFFAPTLEALDERHFRVSGHYLVSLERHPSLADLLHYLLLKPSYCASTAEIQTSVWKQSLATQGWQQKIRNTIMRLRDFFPQTIAPIIVHHDDVSLFKEAITIQPSRREGLDTNAEILRLLAEARMSSTQLSRRLKISAATTKRILKRLTEDNAILAIKEGRNVFYEASPAPVESTT